MANGQVNVPLDIPNVVVLDVEIQGESVPIKVESSHKYAYCHQCGRKMRAFHSYGAWVTVQHLPSFGQPVFIHYRPQRYECPSCDNDPTTRQPLKGHESNRPHTKA